MISGNIIKIKSQSLLEYTLLIATVVSALVAMNIYINRAVQGKLHTIESEMNPGIIVNQ